MNSANKGAFLVDKNLSIGITMDILDKEQEQNPNILEKNIHLYDTFADRKKHLMHFSDCNIFFPGGMGTLDEFTDILNLYKTDAIEKKNVYLVGEKYWNSLKEWFRFNQIKWPDKFITLITDDIDDILEDLDFINRNKKTSLVLFDNKKKKSRGLKEIDNNKDLNQLFSKNDKNKLDKLNVIDDLIDTLVSDILKGDSTEPLLKKDDSETKSDDENKKSRFKIVDYNSNDEDFQTIDYNSSDSEDNN